LLLERAKRAEVAVRVENVFDGRGAERADQLVLQIRDADEEAQALDVDAREIAPEAGALEPTPNVALLGDVVETGQLSVEPARPERAQEPTDRLRAADRHDGHALCGEVPVTTLGQSLDGDLVADPFDQHDRVEARQAFVAFR
jgi:hypothetical protein